MDSYSVQTIAGKDYILLEREDISHQIDMDAISSWGVLLGITDEAELLKAIVQHASTEGSTVNWGELYDALGENLDAMSASGVPVGLAEDLLDPLLGSPVPGPEKIEKLERVRAKAISDLWSEISPPDLDEAALTALVFEIDSNKVKVGRTDFIDALAPVYEIAYPPPLASSDLATNPSV